MPAQGVGNREDALQAIRTSVTFYVDLVPAENLPDDFADLNTNVAKVNLEGRDFYALIGKTATRD
ncbi:hypothetical protein OG749_01445 [Streptomyces nojiriensis]|uniref:hypothetical protein n=1 Tax=Streptomyces nojiriensis TaxID=66374 RepID=UPI002E16EE19